jgi:PilZ domain
MDLAMAVHVDAPVQLSCGLSEVSFAGAGLDCELPCREGAQVSFRLELPTHGAALVATSIALQAEVVRVAQGHTGVRFVDLDREQSRAIHELVAEQQRVMLAARRSR